MSSRECKNSPNCFCYVYGFCISGKHITYKIVKGTKHWTAYILYFWMYIGNQNKPWSPHVICGSSKSNLEEWLRGSGNVMSLAVSRVWREPQSHHDDCNFCMINISKYCKISGRAMTYPSIPSLLASVPHNKTLPVPNPQSKVNFFCGSLTLIYLF